MELNTAPYTIHNLLVSIGSFVSKNPVSLVEFTRLCEEFPDLISEREASGRIVIKAPTTAGHAENEGHFCGYLHAWNRAKGSPGVALSPSAGILLKDEEMRCGNAVWISNERLAPFLTDPDHGKQWTAAVPEFVVELRSALDQISTLKRKMKNSWLANGVLLGWLVDTDNEVAYIYRQGQTEPEEVRDFDHSILSGEDVLPGFRFPLAELG